MCPVSPCVIAPGIEKIGMAGSLMQTFVVNRYVSTAKLFFTMQNTPLLFSTAFGLLVFSLAGCKGNSTETVENRSANGQVERYQRRKHDFAKEGQYQRFSAEGKLLEEAHYVNDTLEGERKYFFPNGTLESVEYYRRGKNHGKYQKFYENGRLNIEQDFADGAMQGFSLAYYPNGVLKEKVTIVDSEENGPFQEYWENGNLKAEGAYKPGEEESAEQGELKEYDENGQLIRIADCNMGVCLTKWKKQE